MEDVDDWTSISGSRHSLIAGPTAIISNLFSHRQVLTHFIKRDFRVTYHGHILGYAWSLIEPLIFTAIFYLVFVILRGSGDEYLPLTIMIGILFFNAFSRTVNGCTTVLTRNSGLIQQIYFPREIFIASITGFQTSRLMLSLAIVFLYMYFVALPPTLLLLLLPLSIFGITLLGFGLGAIASMLHVRIRDTGQVVQLLMRAGFFLSGVFYSAEHIPEEILDIHLMNPIAVYIEMARSAVYGDMGVLTVQHIGTAILSSFLFFFIGAMAFTRFQSKAVKYL